MVGVRKAGALKVVLLLAAVFLLLRFVAQCVQTWKDTIDSILPVDPPKFRMVDTRRVSESDPRDEFFYELQPWRVQEEIANTKPRCKYFSQHTKTVKRLHVVVFIKSATAYSDRRETVRQTWGKISHVENVAMHVIFVVGMAPPDIQDSLCEENKKHGDILQFLGVDDYRHIVYKVLAGMQWAKDHLPQHYLYASADDDLLVNLALFARRLRMHLKWAEKKTRADEQRTLSKLLLHMPILCVFSYREKESPVRNKDAHWGKYYLDPREFPMDILPPFCLGGWYMMPVERVGKLYDASRVKRAISMDDVWITGMLRVKIDPDIIEPIDKSALLRGSDHVKHLWGDFKKDQNIADMVSEAWDPILTEIKTKRHCIRDGYE